MLNSKEGYHIALYSAIEFNIDMLSSFEIIIKVRGRSFTIKLFSYLGCIYCSYFVLIL